MRPSQDPILAERPPLRLPRDASQLETLVALAREATPAARSELTAKIGSLLADANLSQSERTLAGEILLHILRDAEMEVRKALARRLAEDHRAPVDLIVALANDALDVAGPVLVRSPVLRDADLVEVVRTKTRQHQLVVAMREGISETVSNALVETGHEDVVLRLLNNSTARMGKTALGRAVEMSRTAPQLQEPLVQRTDLDPDLAGKMYAWVSDALRKQIMLNFDVPQETIERAMTDSLAEVLAQHVRSYLKDENAQRIADALLGRGEITVELLLSVLRAGDIKLFEALFARHTGLKLTTARKCLYEPGAHGLAAACKVAGFEKPDFAALFLLSRQARQGDKSVDPAELPTTLEFFDRLTANQARALLNEWYADGTIQPASAPKTN